MAHCRRLARARHARPSYYLHAERQAHRKRCPTEEKSATDIPGRSAAPQRDSRPGVPGAQDARPFEKQAEVRTFTSRRLDRTGRMDRQGAGPSCMSPRRRRTPTSSSGVSDVYPDGRSILLMDYVRRGPLSRRIREGSLHGAGQGLQGGIRRGLDQPDLQRGHRIRITVASTGAPFYEPNPNTGEPLTIDFPTKTVVATNAVHHERLHASRVIAPLYLLDDQRGQLERGRKQLDGRLSEAAGAIRTSTPTRRYSPRG